MTRLGIAAAIERQTIGMDMFDVLLVGMVGTFAGAVLGALVGWRVGRD